MGVLVLNGSPKAGASNTMKLTAAFLEGLGRADIETINISGENIKHCTGCYACWEKTPGVCCIADDMHNLLQKYIASDLVIWGVLYLGVGIFTWFFMQSTYASFTGLINSIVPACAGIFTAVFVKWHPAHFARKEIKPQRTQSFTE